MVELDDEAEESHSMEVHVQYVLNCNIYILLWLVFIVLFYKYIFCFLYDIIHESIFEQFVGRWIFNVQNHVCFYLVILSNFMYHASPFHLSLLFSCLG